MVVIVHPLAAEPFNSTTRVHLFEFDGDGDNHHPAGVSCRFLHPAV